VKRRATRKGEKNKERKFKQMARERRQKNQNIIGICTEKLQNMNVDKHQMQQAMNK
jgi:hypothetical protein